MILTSGCYHLTEDDSVEALKIDTAPTRVLLILYGAVTLILLAACIVGPLKLKIQAGLALLGGTCGASLVRHVIAPFNRRRSYRRSKFLHDEYTIEVNENHIRIFTPLTDVTIPPDKIVKWKEGKNHILIYAAPRLYFAIPKRLAQQNFDLRVLRERLQQSEHLAN